MILIDCKACDGTGKLPEKIVESSYDKRSKQYKIAIKDIMKSNPEITQKEAEKLFDNAYKNGD